MDDIYFTAVTDSKEDWIKFNFPPLKFNAKTCEIVSVKSPINAQLYEKDLVEDSKLKHCLGIIPFVMKFPGRQIRNIKVSLDDKFAIFSSDCSYLKKQGWYGVAIMFAEKEDFPITREQQLSKSIYDIIGKHFENQGKDNVMPEITDELGLYWCDYEASKRSFYSEKFKGENYKLEGIVEPTKDSVTKWDFFLFDERGFPLTGIYRYSHSGFVKLDMKRFVKIPSYEGILDGLHKLNCLSLNACGEMCRLLGDGLNVKRPVLRHISSYLHDDIGIGFTFLDKAVVDGKEVNFALDVKNKLYGFGKYVDRLFGKERETLDLVREKLIEEQTTKQDEVFRVFKKVIASQKKKSKNFI